MIREECTGPVFVVAHRDGVSYESETPTVVDPLAVVTGEVDDDSVENHGVVLFDSYDAAHRFMASTPIPGCIIATFAGSDHLRSCLQFHFDKGASWAIYNLPSGAGRTRKCRLTDIIESLR